MEVGDSERDKMSELNLKEQSHDLKPVFKLYTATFPFFRQVVKSIILNLPKDNPPWNITQNRHS